MNIDELLIITIVLWILLIVLIMKSRKNEGVRKYMEAVDNAKRDMDILSSITKNIEENYKPVNIKLTKYEQEQEDNAIISYDELVRSKEKNDVHYDNGYKNKVDVDVKKVNLSNNVGSLLENSSINVRLMSYEKEEAFLRALKQLQSDLAR